MLCATKTWGTLNVGDHVVTPEGVLLEVLRVVDETREARTLVVGSRATAFEAMRCGLAEEQKRALVVVA